MNSRTYWRPVAVVAVVVLVVLGFLYGVRSQSPSVVVVASSTPTASAATAAPLATDVAVRKSPDPNAIATFPLGPLRGQIAWVVRTPVPVAVPNPPTPSGTRALMSYELWAIPLDGSTPRVAVRYRSAVTNNLTSDPRDTNVLRRQFSPDGRRVILSVATADDGNSQELRVIDLETGAVATPFQNAFPTATHLEVNPAWSPDGAHIAFVRLAAGGASGELWVSNPDGSAAKSLWTTCNACQPSSPLIHFALAPPRIYGWLPDSQHIGFDPINFEQSGFAVIDLNGVATDPAAYAASGSDPASWRDGSPALAFGAGGGNPPNFHTRILVSDGPQDRLPPAVADVTVNPNDNTVTGVRDPRWDPWGSRQLIYLETGVQGSFVIADLDARTTKRVSGRVARADWISGGDAIVTLEEHPSTAPLSVYVYERNGTPRRSGLFLDPINTNYTLTDLAARSY